MFHNSYVEFILQLKSTIPKHEDIKEIEKEKGNEINFLNKSY